MAKLTQSTKTTSANDVVRKYHVIDVKDQVLGRVANKIAELLQGKHKVDYVPNIDVGDEVIVINARHIVVTGKKAEAKLYDSFSGYPGGLRQTPFKTMIEKRPSEIIRQAVSGMLPKNKLRDRRLARLHVFAEDKHPFEHKVNNK